MSTAATAADAGARPLKVVTILGTRPEIVRLSATIALLDATPGVHHVLVHTGQNYDPGLSQVFFRDLGIRPPDHHLDAAGDTVAETVAQILVRTEATLTTERPDAVLVLGDTNSALSAYVAKRMKIPVFHMEAGNRSFDPNVPEETNRRIVDHLADVNLVYSEHARRHLLAEGFPHRNVLLTGSPMREVLDRAAAGIAASTVHDRLGTAPGAYYVASLHREENVDDPARLRDLVEVLERLSHDAPVIVSTHPRTRRRLHDLGSPATGTGVRFLDPMGYFDYVRLQRDATCTVSDSGTVAEEAAILGFPAVTPRDAIERPEGLEVGCVIVTGTKPGDVLRGVEVVVDAHVRRAATGQGWPVPEAYTVADTSHRAVTAIVGLTPLVHLWSGVRRPEAREP